MRAIHPAQIEDCKTAIRWLRKNAASLNIAPEKIGVWGGSVGGQVDCACVSQKKRVK